MKKTLLIMVMALALLLTQCRKPSIKFPTPSVTTTVSMTITAGPGSKTDISTMGGIVWSENDKIYVGDGSKYVGYLSIVSGVGNATGTFTGDVTVATGDDCTFHFYYLGHDNGVAPAAGATEVTVDFSSQNIYEDNNHKLKNASGQHVGYGKAEHVKVEADKPVTGLQVSMKSKVAIAYFCFQKGEGERANPYTGALTLSGTNIYNKMTVKFDASDFDFTPVKDGNISLTNTTTHLKYAMLVPAGTSAATLNFIGGAGTTVLENGIEANKFYRVDGSMPIVVTINAYVDLGLPSGLLWATCNLGAEHPYDYGDYYAWGATTTWYEAGYAQENPQGHWKSGYSDGYTWPHCPFTNGNYLSNKKVFTKYVPQSQASTYGSGDFYDNKTVLDASDDAASANLGTGWRMPTIEEWKALYDNTTSAWTDDYNGIGVAGRVFTSNDGKGTTLFIPAADIREGKDLSSLGSIGNYWSSSLGSSTPNYACATRVRTGGVDQKYEIRRYYGCTVRPVRGGATPEPPATPKFSVGATTVEFAPGNLYWDGSAFKFESNQWETTPTAVDQTDSSGTWSSSHVSHFLWSPDKNVAVGTSTWVFGTTNDVFFTNATETTANSGFHVNGETGENQWRTLSKGEWDYLLNTSGGSSGRTDANRFAKAKVNGVNGLLIFPDGYNGGTAIGSITGVAALNDKGAVYPTANIPTGTWISMETAGVVFLPAAGCRYGTGVNSVGRMGCYWSSTADMSNYAFYMYFTEGNVSPDVLNRNEGGAVRLVRAAS